MSDVGVTSVTFEKVLRSRVLAPAFMAMTDTDCVRWAAEGPEMGPLLNHGFDVLAHSFDDSADLEG